MKKVIGITIVIAFFIGIILYAINQAGSILLGLGVFALAVLITFILFLGITWAIK